MMAKRKDSYNKAWDLFQNGLTIDDIVKKTGLPKKHVCLSFTHRGGYKKEIKEQKVKVTAGIIKAIDMAIVIDFVNQTEFIEKVEIDRSSIHLWRRGKRKSILPIIWEKLYPFIKPYLQEDIQYIQRKPQKKYVRQGVMINITESIMDAIKSAIGYSGSQRRFSKISGISPVQIRKYKNATVKQIRPATWNRLKPHVEQYMTKIEAIRQTKLEKIVEEMIEECGNRADAEENECFGCSFKCICKHIKFSVKMFSKEQIIAELNKEQ